MSEFQYTPRGEIVVIHEGTPAEPSLFTFKSDPTTFYTFKVQDDGDTGCGDCCFSGQKVCGDAPSCGYDTPLYDYLTLKPLSVCEKTKFSKRFYVTDAPELIEYNGLNVEKVCL